MFLRQIKIQDVRSIRSLQLSFEKVGHGRKWTYLLGENGTGKSSVLRCIALVLAGSEATPELVASPDDWIRLGCDEARIEVKYATAEGSERSANFTFLRGETSLDCAMRNRADLELIDRALAHAERNYFVVAYGVTRRPQSSRLPFGESSLSMRSPRARAVATLFTPDVTLISLEQWAMDLEYRKGRSGLAAVRRALDLLLPDVTFAGIDREKRRLMFSTPDGKLPLSALSDGYQAIAGWCGDLLWQITENFKDYRDPLTARGLLLVDEVDIHLHPVWQHRLVSFLDKILPNIQVVVTTHSPLTIHQADAGELYVLRRDGRDNCVALHPYEGAPNRLLLSQLIESPIFGLNSLDSPQVQKLREELRELTGVGDRPGKRNSSSAKRIRQIERELSTASNWEDVPPYLERTNKLLERVASKLAPGIDGSALDEIARLSNPDALRRRK